MQGVAFTRKPRGPLFSKSVGTALRGVLCPIFSTAANASALLHSERERLEVGNRLRKGAVGDDRLKREVLYPGGYISLTPLAEGY